MPSPSPIRSILERPLRKEAWAELPHLSSVFRDSLWQRSDLSIFDYDEDWRPTFVRHRSFSFAREDLDQSMDELGDLVLSKRRGCHTRVIIVQDLCSQLMSILFGFLDLNIELFEEHLLNSAWSTGTDASKPDIQPERAAWNSRRVRKDYASMKWFRPYITNHPDNLLSIKYRDLILESLKPLKDDELTPNIQALLPESNIWRRHLNLRVEGDTWSFDEWMSNSINDQTPIASEERITIWQGFLRDSETAILLILVDDGLSTPLSRRGATRTTSGPRSGLTRKSGDPYWRLGMIREFNDNIVQPSADLDFLNSRQSSHRKIDDRLDDKSVLFEKTRKKSEKEAADKKSRFELKLTNITEQEEAPVVNYATKKTPYQPTCEDASTHDSDVNEYVFRNLKHPKSDEVLVTEYGSSKSEIAAVQSAANTNSLSNHSMSNQRSRNPSPSAISLQTLSGNDSGSNAPSINPTDIDPGEAIQHYNPDSNITAIETPRRDQPPIPFQDSEHKVLTVQSEPNLRSRNYPSESGLPMTQNWHRTSVSLPIWKTNMSSHSSLGNDDQHFGDQASEQSDLYGGTPPNVMAELHRDEATNNQSEDRVIPATSFPLSILEVDQPTSRNEKSYGKPEFSRKLHRSTSVSAKKPKLKKKDRGEDNERSYFYPPRLILQDPLFTNIAARGPAQYASLESAMSRGYFQLVTTTREDICSWLEFDFHEPSPRPFMLGPISCIFELMAQDTYDFLQLVDSFLDGIVAASDDELKLQKHILLWRTMLGILSRELRVMMDTIPSFAIYLLHEPNRNRRPRLDPRHYWQRRTDELHGRISQAQRRIEQAYTFLASSASISESRRGISEAESVSRLTELAFVYIPLSFAATFFSMQVRELEQSKTTIWGFVGLGLGVTILSYAVRILIRSRWHKSTCTSIMKSVRHDSGMRDGQSIPTTSYIVWFWHMLVRDPVNRNVGSWRSGFGISLAITACGLFPMISVWASSAITGNIKTVISVTMILMFIVIVSLYVMMNARAIRTWYRGLRERRRRRKIRQSINRRSANV